LAHGREAEAIAVLSRLTDEAEDSRIVLEKRDEILGGLAVESEGGKLIILFEIKENLLSMMVSRSLSLL